MQCKEVLEICDVYLSDELLAEANMQALQHLKECPMCRVEFESRRLLQQKLKKAVKEAPEFQIDSAFALRLAANLREAALCESRPKTFGLKLLVPIMASLLIGFSIFLAFKYVNTKHTPIASQNNALSQLLPIVIHEHLDCAIEKLQMWEQLSRQDYAEKDIFMAKIVTPLKKNFSNDLNLLHVHECDYGEKKCKHLIMQKGNDCVISIFIYETEGLTNNEVVLTHKEQDNLQVASIQKKPQTVFVVSNLTTSESLSLAQALLEAL
ncbi:MAG: hypothetical protein D6687_03965 [Acidobacteria bacterium]|jgi:hypothetical protein|nr:MAG: hypothetical protein D6687_03965 [Acidobacteriota bacterium]GIU80948.1 MAG: hypothetical protein KatS3mg006_0012 [Pyrinomonadaceae bacterium]